MSEKKGYFRLPDSIVDDGIVARMGLAALAVYVVLSRRADAEGDSYPGIRRIAKDAGLSKQGVQNAVRKLVEMGLVAVERGQSIRGSNVYKLVNPVVQVSHSVGQGGQRSRTVVGNVVGHKGYPIKGNTKKEYPAVHSWG